MPLLKHNCVVQESWFLLWVPPCLGQSHCSPHAALSTLLTPPWSNHGYHQLL